MSGLDETSNMDHAEFGFPYDVGAAEAEAANAAEAEASPESVQYGAANRAAQVMSSGNEKDAGAIKIPEAPVSRPTREDLIKDTQINLIEQ